MSVAHPPRFALCLACLALVVVCACRKGPPESRRKSPILAASARLPRLGALTWQAQTPPALGCFDEETRRAEQEAAYDVSYPYHGVAFHMLAQVLRAPRVGAGVAGYLRRGARFRARRGEHGSGCQTQWYEVEGGGFVCAGGGVIIGRDPQDFAPSPCPPDRHATLPYRYGRIVARNVPQYYRLPSAEEETDVVAAIAHVKLSSLRPPLDRVLSSAESVQTAPEEEPSRLERAETVPDYVRVLMQPGFYVSIDGYEVAPSGRRFARTVGGAYVAADRLLEATASPFHGTVTPRGLQQPVGLVFRRRAAALVRSPEGGFSEAPSLGRFDSFVVVAAPLEVDGGTYLPSAEGPLIDARAVRVARRHPRPQGVPRSARWIDIDLGQQVLVAYQGAQAVFATLVATGKPGFETPAGLYRIHAKHVSATMDGTDTPEDAYSIEDVPWTMYFKGSLALHGAFWHDRFGRVRSHGCVNLAPADARLLFEWSRPSLPPGFHGVLPGVRDESTYVLIRDSTRPEA